MEKRGVTASSTGIVVVIVLLLSFFLGYSFATKPQPAPEPQQADPIPPGWQNYQSGNYDQAISHFQAQTSTDSRLGLGWSYYKVGQLNEAKDTFQELIRQKPQNSEGYSGLGWTNYYLNDFDGAVDAFQQGLAKEERIQIKNGLARSLYRVGNIQESKEMYTQINDEFPHYVFPLAGLFIIAYEQGDDPSRYAESLHDFSFDTGIEHDPNYIAFGKCVQKLTKPIQEDDLYDCSKLL